MSGTMSMAQLARQFLEMSGAEKAGASSKARGKKAASSSASADPGPPKRGNTTAPGVRRRRVQAELAAMDTQADEESVDRSVLPADLFAGTGLFGAKPSASAPTPAAPAVAAKAPARAKSAPSAAKSAPAASAKDKQQQDKEARLMRDKVATLVWQITQYQAMRSYDGPSFNVNDKMSVDQLESVRAAIEGHLSTRGASKSALLAAMWGVNLVERLAANETYNVFGFRFEGATDMFSANREVFEPILEEFAIKYPGMFRQSVEMRLVFVGINFFQNVHQANVSRQAGPPPVASPAN